MKKETFDEFVNRFYHIKNPAPKKHMDSRVIKKLKSHLEAIKDQDDWDQDPDTVSLVEEIESKITPVVNQTLPYEITGFKQETRICPDCDRECKSTRRIQSQLYFTPQKHWRHSCTHCKQTKNPETGKFNVNNKSVHSFFIEYFKKKK